MIKGNKLKKERRRINMCREGEKKKEKMLKKKNMKFLDLRIPNEKIRKLKGRLVKVVVVKVNNNIKLSKRLQIGLHERKRKSS